MAAISLHVIYDKKARNIITWGQKSQARQMHDFEESAESKLPMLAMFESRTKAEDYLGDLPHKFAVHLEVLELRSTTEPGRE